MEYHDVKTSDAALKLFLDDLDNKRSNINYEATMVDPSEPAKEHVDDITTQLKRGLDARLDATEMYKKA